MPSYCCFWCPAKGFTVRAADERCPTCGRPYNTPLREAPAEIGPYVVDAPVSRGFYGAVYRATQASLNRTVVLKVVPKVIYEFFGKDWKSECEEHALLADGTPLIAAITDRFDTEVEFGGSSLPCHVAVLANIPGPTLQEMLKAPDKHGLTPRTAAQIAADLFEILSVFSERGRFHNDLHAGNVIVQRLKPATLRLGAIAPSVRAVAVDLGSVLDKSLSGDGQRLGDHSHVAQQIAALAAAVHTGSSARSDTDYRIASALRGLAEHLSPAAGAQRIMTTEDALRAIRYAMNTADEPWRQRLSLARFSDAYNAQALESWHVPELWFDPDNNWLRKTTARGPQVITGMRGCGKTMLLRAIHFHARAPREVVGDELHLADEFVGVYASCQKLLNPQDFAEGKNDSVPYPFERLLVAYLRDAVQVLRHVRSLSPTSLLGPIDVLLRDALKLIEGPSEPEQDGEEAFEQALIDLQFKLADGVAGFRLRLAPAEAFGQLALLIRAASPALVGKYVLFLLDDVSTRYLHGDMVRRVISQLLFQHPHCAFRITTEAQALHRVLLSPGGWAPADPNRDYEVFDLGNEVYRMLREGSTRDRMDFVSEILRRRGRQFPEPVYQRDPLEVLGDTNLESIAKEIAGSSPTSPARKRVYRGLRALQAVCVGDLGDVVKLYERILFRAELGKLPVSPVVQTECFLEYSANLLLALNRRDQQKKSLALAFAQASGELLYRSGQDGDRLRQYTKLYVRVDAGPAFEEVSNRILDLLDAGVFVYDGGVARTKTRDSDPVLQFKLSFRKMLGLASFVGLSDRDRFELSGDLLRRWLTEPEQAKRILLDSESKAAGDDRFEMTETEPDASPLEIEEHDGGVGAREGAEQGAGQLELALTSPEPERAVSCAPNLGVTVVQGSLSAWKGRKVDAVVLALGFEQRARDSAERVLATLRPERAILVRYGADQGLEVAEVVGASGVPTQTVETIEELSAAMPKDGSDVVVDSSGLSKPFLFASVRDALLRTGRVGVVHTLAERYYPRNEDLLGLGVGSEGAISGDALGKLGDVLTGEAGPYHLERVHQADASPERWRGLIASASPKNDRLLHLLEQRACDAARILVPPPTTPRRKLAWAAAELAASAADANVALVEVDTNDIEGALRATEEMYHDLYHRSGANVEIGLTGSKIHAVAFAALAAAGRVSGAWYVCPESFDRQRFTQGTGQTECFDLVFEPWGQS